MSPAQPILTGIHHVTAITADAQKNVDFYCGVLGLRLVKRTVNFDDPGSYHLYYGDELGRPGTILTFFAWPGGRPARVGPPQVTSTAFAVPTDALPFWQARLTQHGVITEDIITRFDDQVLGFADPDNMRLEIVASHDVSSQPWHSTDIPTEHAITGFHSVTIAEEGYESTARLLTDLMGFQFVSSDANRFRYQASHGDGFASKIDLICVPDSPHGTMGAGAVHHVAFRTPDDTHQAAWRKSIADNGFNISPVMDRTYFHSLYFREPGGVLFEIATDTPGFTIDEAVEELGSNLMLPKQFEYNRADIERRLPPLNLS